MMFLPEHLRDAYYATDEILAGRPPDEFIVIMQTPSGQFGFFVEAFEKHNFLKRTSIREEANVYTFTGALDTVDQLTDYWLTSAKAVLRRDSPVTRGNGGRNSRG